ncbi:hypothetical protein H8E77_40025 [bacterium]|nr:hypothetical protein [bacterium]
MNVRIKIKGSSWFKRYRLQFIIGVVAILALAYLGEPQLQTQAQDPEKPISVLFIGNSYTIWDWNLPLTLSRMATTATPPMTIKTGQSVVPGTKLDFHWNNGDAVNKIRQAGWDFVVLQEWSKGPVEELQQMREFARKFDAEIKKSGAQTVFFMTWGRQHLPEMIEDIAKAYNDIGTELKATVAPVGRAWQRSIKERPGILLHKPDKSHPSAHGVYLSACVFYTVLTGKPPLGLSNGGLTQVSEVDARFLQEIALETVKEYNPKVLAAVSLKDKLPMTWGEVKVYQK